MIHCILISEDALSETVARKILMQSDKDYKVATPLRWNKDQIRQRIRNINKSATGFPYLVFTDQDTEERCPPVAIRELRAPLHANLLYRFAVMEIESWVMAHREAIASFLSVPLSKIPHNPDSIPHPKEHLVNLARRSRSSSVRKDLVPRENSTSKVGADYNGRLAEFVLAYWDVGVAIECSPSLQRAYARVNDFYPKT